MLPFKISITMASSSSSISLKSPLFPHSSITRRKSKAFESTRIHWRRRSSDDARDHQNYGDGNRVVDENLIVLRKRIHEMKMIERNYEPPSEWMDWEKRYYASYDSYICEAMGFLQSYLMNTRPSLALGMMALIAFSVSTSTAVVMSRFMDIINSGLAGIHL